MRVAVVGATGRTGALVVAQAAARGHDVIAVARRVEAVVAPAAVEVRAADVHDREAVTAALAGTDAVVSALGVGTGRAPTDVYSVGVTNILAAMQTHDIAILAAISAAPAGPRAELPLSQRALVLPILDRFFGASYADMRRMEAILARSDRDWMALRPPRLLDRPAQGHYRIDAEHPLPKLRSITYADLATALLDSLDRPDLYRRAAWVAN